MLKFNNVTFRYPGAHRMALEDISLEFTEGSVYGLLGSNGVGKSTLLSVGIGLLTPLRGNATLDGTDVRRRLPSTMSELFIVPEEVDLPKVPLSAFASTTGAFYPRFSSDDMLRHLELFNIDGDPNLGRLSMGQKKKVALAFAMACNTRVLMMDEPTNGLDIPGKSAFRRFVAQSMADDRVFIISTHQVRDVGQILDHVVILDNRSVLLDSPVDVIQEKLSFTETNDPALIASAIYTEPGIGGSSLILPNNGNGDSAVNLELLFNFATTNPAQLGQIFKQ